ncbi:hypothetical protein DFH06DRAFT_175264 [Mycena polygramma]|nr:hypothetical protein DFH06DRAFT_175264 [Mycena polygramma]
MFTPAASSNQMATRFLLFTSLMLYSLPAVVAPNPANPAICTVCPALPPLFSSMSRTPNIDCLYDTPGSAPVLHCCMSA